MRTRLGFPLSLNDIAKAVNGTKQRNINPVIQYISTDTREIFEGDLFIPIKGSNFDGEEFVNEAKRKGAFTVSLINKNADVKAAKSDRPLLDLASFYKEFLPYILYRVGITGSVGKTTTKEFLRVILSGGYRVHASEGNFNNEIGMPMSVLQAPTDTEILITEMGMNHLGEIGRMAKCICPNLSIITNIGSAHIGNLGSRENIAKAKLEIVDAMSDGKVYVLDEEELLKNTKNRVGLSLKNPKADFYLERTINGITLYEKGIKLLEAEFAFSEEHYLECLILACASALDIGLPINLLSKGISAISSDNIRQKDYFVDGYNIIDDSYNASLESIKASIKGIESRCTGQRKSLLLGDVLELGEFSEDYHFKIGASIPPSLFSEIFLFGNHAEHMAKGTIAAGFPACHIHINKHLDHPEITAKQIRSFCKSGEVILFKASRGIRLERIIEILKEEQNE